MEGHESGVEGGREGGVEGPGEVEGGVVEAEIGSEGGVVHKVLPAFKFLREGGREGVGDGGRERWVKRWKGLKINMTACE